MPADLDEAREQWFWAVVVRAAAASSIALAVLGALVSAAVHLGWGSHLTLCALGLLSGLLVSLAVHRSPQNRALAMLLIGGITLPLVSVDLAGAAAVSEPAFRARGAGLLPFLVNAAGAAAAGLSVSAVWRGRPARPSSQAESSAEEAVDLVAPAPGLRAGAGGPGGASP